MRLALSVILESLTRKSNVGPFLLVIPAKAGIHGKETLMAGVPPSMDSASQMRRLWPAHEDEG